MFDPARPIYDAHREHVRAYAWDAVNGELGRSELEPRYIAQTEGRDVGAARGPYSSCGDLVHGAWFDVGCRSHWVNRKENGSYQVGANISKICYSLAPLGRRTLQPDSLILCGDAFVIWNKDDSSDAHTFLALEHNRETGELLSADYGQPGGGLRRRMLVWEHIGGVDVAFVVGKTKKRVRVWAPLDCVIDVAKSEGRFEARDTVPAPPPEAA